jgi:hypothetical protein
MPKRDVEGQLGDLSRLRSSPEPETAIPQLRKALADRINLIVAKAAEVAAALRLRPLLPDLLAAYDRLFPSGAEDDPKCAGKAALVQALIDFDYDESVPFLRGYRYVQMEATFYKVREDTASPLRSLCTLGLIQCADLTRAEKFRCLLNGITDAAEPVRIDTLRAIEQMEGEEAALLCRLKAGLGDKSASVTGQAIESVLRLEGERALDFAQTFLGSSDEPLIEEASLAIGASRLPAAIDVLKQAYGRRKRPVFLRAISIARLETGFELLLSMVRDGNLAALDALSIHRDSTEIQAAVEKAVEAAGNESLNQHYRAKFGDR